MVIFLVLAAIGSEAAASRQFFRRSDERGAGIALLIQLPLLPFALFGLIAWGLGIVGLTPTLTCVVFCRNAKAAWRLGTRADGPKANRHFWLGLLLALLVPLVVYAVCGQWLPQAIQWLPHLTAGQQWRMT